MALRCVYTDLDGTLLGKDGSVFHDYEGNFSRKQSLALEACNRTGVEVVIKSGRRESSVIEDAKLLGLRSYIYEAGCAVVIDGERSLLTGEWVPDDEGTVAEKMIAAGVSDLLLERYSGRLEDHAPWDVGRELSMLYRGNVDVAEANEVLVAAGHASLRFLDNGAVSHSMPGLEVTKAYHVVPAGVSKATAVAFHMRARGYAPEECIGVGDSLEDLDVAEVVGRFFVPANGPEGDSELVEAIAGRANVTVTEGRSGDGFYEAVVSTLAGT